MAKRHSVPWRRAEPGTPEWDAWTEELERAIGHSICGGKTRVKNPGPSPCEQSPLAGRERCKLHGGATPIGPASPHWRTGSRSKLVTALPARYQDAFNEAMDDPELLSARHAIAVLDSRRAELYTHLSTGESGAAWAAAARHVAESRKALEDVRAAISSRNADALARALEDLQRTQENLSRVVQQGLSDIHIWQEIVDIGEAQRRQRTQEQKLLEAHEHSIERERVNALFMRLLGLIQSAVSTHAANEIGKAIMTDVSSGVNQLIAAAAERAA